MIHCWTLGLQIKAPQRCQAPVNQRLTPCLAQKQPFVCRYHPFAGPYDGGFFGICINRLSFLNNQSWQRCRMSRRSCSCSSQVTTPIPSNSQGFDPFDSSFWSQGLGKWTREPQVVELLLPTGNVAVDLSWLGCWDYFEIGLNASFQPLSLCTKCHQATLQTSADLNFFACSQRFGVRLTGLVILQELFKIYLRHGLKAWRSGWGLMGLAPAPFFCPTEFGSVGSGEQFGAIGARIQCYQSVGWWAGQDVRRYFLY